MHSLADAFQALVDGLNWEAVSGPAASNAAAPTPRPTSFLIGLGGMAPPNGPQPIPRGTGSELFDRLRQAGEEARSANASVAASGQAVANMVHAANLAMNVAGQEIGPGTPILNEAGLTDG